MAGEEEKIPEDPFFIRFVINEGDNIIAEIRDNPGYQGQKLTAENFLDTVLYAELRKLAVKGYKLGDPQLFCSDPDLNGVPDRILVRVSGGLLS